jgi:diguanylate cyclase (GGDEF)-like protein/PAS domain S-box-containing protein
MLRNLSPRLMSTAASVLFGALMAGTLLYLVPTLALSGAVVAAAIATVAVVGGLAALGLLHREQLRQAGARLEEERASARLRRFLVEHGGEAYMVVDPSGRVTFTSSNVARVLGIDPATLNGKDGLLDRVRPDDRRRVLQEFARVRRQPGASVGLEVASNRPDDRDLHLDIRATNLTDEPAVGGILLVIRDVTLRKTVESEVQHLAYYDALSGLANRRFFFEQGRTALALARRRGTPACVLSIDLDRFRQVNDLLGHEAGDVLLQRVADALRRAVRESDVVARLAGDEFAVLLADVRDADAAGRAVTRILEGMPMSMAAGGHEVLVTASIGVAMYPDDGEDLEALLKAADLAMDRAKNSDLSIQYYRPELRELITDRMRLEQDMQRALERHEFQLHYQPVFDLTTGAMVGAEALSRWRHFSRGMVAAAEFIDLAESSGLISALDRWALTRAIHQRAATPEGAFPGWVAVNLSAQSLADGSLPDFIREVMERHGAEPGSLVLELPDTAVGIDPAAAARLIHRLRAAGAAIALDNYGTGRLSFSQLRELPVDIVKLGVDFVQGVRRGEAEERFADAAIALAHDLQARVLAKGVERTDQVQWLRQAGCDLIQGYLMSAPVPVDDLLDFARGEPGTV